MYVCINIFTPIFNIFSMYMSAYCRGMKTLEIQVEKSFRRGKKWFKERIFKSEPMNQQIKDVDLLETLIFS